MQVPLVMTVIGKDRPGLVESVASLVEKHGGNWLESRMCRLGGQFAGILRVHVDSASEKALLAALAALSERGLTVDIHPGQPAVECAHSRLAMLEIVGQDRPGIVRHITSALSRQNVNVEELVTECISAPMSGETMFKATAKLMIPQSCQVSTLRKELEQVASDLVVDLTFQELPAK